MDKITLYHGIRKNLPKGADPKDLFFSTDHGSMYAGQGPFKPLLSYNNVFITDDKSKFPLVGDLKTIYIVHNNKQSVMFLWDLHEHVYVTDNTRILKAIDHNLTLKYAYSYYTLINSIIYEDLTLTLPIVIGNYVIYRFLNVSNTNNITIKTQSTEKILLPAVPTSGKIKTSAISIKPNGYLELYGTARGWYAKSGINNIDLDKTLWAENYVMSWNRPKYISA